MNDVNHIIFVTCTTGDAGGEGWYGMVNKFQALWIVAIATIVNGCSWIYTESTLN